MWNVTSFRRSSNYNLFFSIFLRAMCRGFGYGIRFLWSVWIICSSYKNSRKYVFNYLIYRKRVLFFYIFLLLWFESGKCTSNNISKIFRADSVQCPLPFLIRDIILVWKLQSQEVFQNSILDHHHETKPFMSL